MIHSPLLALTKNTAINVTGPFTSLRGCLWKVAPQSPPGPACVASAWGGKGVLSSRPPPCPQEPGERAALLGYY